MKNNIASGIFLIILIIGVASPVFSQDASGYADILVRFKDQEALSTQNHYSSALKQHLNRHFHKFNISKWMVSLSDGMSLEQKLNILRNDPTIEWAEPNFPRYLEKVPNDPLFLHQWHLLNTGQSGGIPGTDIQADDAWNIATGGPEVVVAVLDTGINYDHPDLKENMWINPDEDWLKSGEPGNNGLDDDNNGYVDDYHGISVVEEPFQYFLNRWLEDPIDFDGHGTHVAGIIGATGNNNLGISGVNWNVKLMALRFLGSGGGTVEGVLKCIAYILDQKQKGVPIKVVNASYGGSNYSRFEKEAYEELRDHGILVVTSAGNSGADLDGGLKNYPGSYQLENIINVAATTQQDRLVSHSNYGKHSVHLGAPGSGILSTYLGDTYKVLGGTSMAAPQVSGALALIYSAFDATMPEAKERLFRGVDLVESLRGRVFTNGRLNLYKALTVDLKGPFIFSVFPGNGKPGDLISLKGVRFGFYEKSSKITFSGVEADIVAWGDQKITCRVPEVALNNEIKVATSQGYSNGVYFYTSTPHRYFFPFVPVERPCQSMLILANLQDETVNLNIMTGEAGNVGSDTFSETLLPRQVFFRNLKEYNLDNLNDILWIESDKHIRTAAVILHIKDGTLKNFTYIRGKQKPKE